MGRRLAAYPLYTFTRKTRMFHSLKHPGAWVVTLTAAGILMSGGIGALTAVQQIQKAVQLVGNFAAGERSRYLGKVDARKGATAQLRWQARNCSPTRPRRCG